MIRICRAHPARLRSRQTGLFPPRHFRGQGLGPHAGPRGDEDRPGDFGRKESRRAPTPGRGSCQSCRPQGPRPRPPTRGIFGPRKGTSRPSCRREFEGRRAGRGARGRSATPRSVPSGSHRCRWGSVRSTGAQRPECGTETSRARCRDDQDEERPTARMEMRIGGLA